MARVRRGCLGVAALFGAFAVIFISSTHNLFYLVFLIGTVISLLLWKVTR